MLGSVLDKSFAWSSIRQKGILGGALDKKLCLGSSINDVTP